MKNLMIIGVLTVALAGCGQLQRLKGNTSSAAPEVDIPPTNAEGQLHPRSRPDSLGSGSNAARGAVPATARTAEDFDTTTAAQRSEAGNSGRVARALGETVASLGDPTQTGFWLKTPLINAAAKGHVTSSQTGKTVQVDLIPIDGENSAGSRISLAAMRVLELPLTALPTVSVFVE